MTVRTAGDFTLALEGDCPASDAEELLRLLLAHPGAIVICEECQQAHTAVIQVLMASGARLRGPTGAAALRHACRRQFVP